MLIKSIVKVVILLHTTSISRWGSFVRASEEVKETRTVDKQETDENNQSLSAFNIDQVNVHELAYEILSRIVEKASKNEEIRIIFLTSFLTLVMPEPNTTDQNDPIWSQLKEMYQDNSYLLPVIIKATYDVLLQYKDDERLKTTMSKFVSFLEILKERKNIAKLAEKHNIMKIRYLLNSYKSDKVIEAILKQLKEIKTNFDSMNKSIDVFMIYKKYTYSSFRNNLDRETTVSDIKFITNSLIILLNAMSMLFNDIIELKQIPGTHFFAIYNFILKETILIINDELNKEEPNYLKIYDSKNLIIIYQMIVLFVDLGAYALNNYTDDELDVFLTNIDCNGEKLFEIRKKIRSMSKNDLFTISSSLLKLFYKTLKTFIEFYKNEQPEKEVLERNMSKIFSFLLNLLDTLSISGSHLRKVLS